jgi:hypothetical protein
MVLHIQYLLYLFKDIFSSVKICGLNFDYILKTILNFNLKNSKPILFPQYPANFSPYIVMTYSSCLQIIYADILFVLTYLIWFNPYKFDSIVNFNQYKK